VNARQPLRTWIRDDAGRCVGAVVRVSGVLDLAGLQHDDVGFVDLIVVAVRLDATDLLEFEVAGERVIGEVPRLSGARYLGSAYVKLPVSSTSPFFAKIV